VELIQTNLDFEEELEKKWKFTWTGWNNEDIECWTRKKTFVQLK
jgi:hypothetical protein